MATCVRAASRLRTPGLGSSVAHLGLGIEVRIWVLDVRIGFWVLSGFRIGIPNPQPSHNPKPNPEPKLGCGSWVLKCGVYSSGKESSVAHMTVCGSVRATTEREGNNSKSLNKESLKTVQNKTMIWPGLTYVCQIRSASVTVADD